MQYLILSSMQVTVSAILLLLLPIPLVLAAREVASTSDLFALHTSEVSKSGYTMCKLHEKLRDTLIEQ